jgi:hypothetical protein
MADIFISYAHEDLATAEAFDRELQSFGWTVWRDDRVGVSGIIDDQIQAELDRASCVVVIWSPSSIRSAWVKAEAEGGDDQGKLVPVSFHRDLSMPIRFRLIKTAMLSSPMLDPDEESAKGFLTELVRVTGKAHLRLKAPPQDGKNRRGQVQAPSARVTGRCGPKPDGPVSESGR